MKKKLHLITMMTRRKTRWKKKWARSNVIVRCATIAAWTHPPDLALLTGREATEKTPTLETTKKTNLQKHWTSTQPV